MQNMLYVSHNPAADPTADEELVLRAQSGDQDSAAILIERYYKTCLKQAIGILKDRQDAEDEVQNACWKAVAHIQQFQRDAKFSTWLTRIVVNQCLMRLRQQRRARLCSIESAGTEEDTQTLDLRDPRISPEQEIGRRELGEVVQREVKALPPILRHVLELRDVQNRPFPDVAEALGITVAAAKSRLLRARGELKTRMIRHQGRQGAATLTVA
jgi:RNA polymerase sigma-70 factor (ECF subfamily)